MSSLRQLSLAAARSHVLKQHGLLTPFDDPHDSLTAAVAVQTQYAASLPCALAARTTKLSAIWHEDDDRAVVKSWTIRNTLHAQTEADFDLMVDGYGEEKYRRYHRWFTSNRDVTESDLVRLEDRIRQELSQGPLTRPELHDRIPEFRSIPNTGWGIDVMGLAYRGELRLIVRDSGPTLFALRTHETKLPPFEARVEILRRYLSAYGPASVADYAYWAGTGVAEARRQFESIAGEVEEVQVEGLTGRRYLPIGSEPSEELPRCRLLAKFDPITMGHKEKALFLPLQHYPKVFRKAGQVEAAVLVDGEMVATWRLVRSGKRAQIQVEPFRRISKATLALVAREAKRLKGALDLAEIGVTLTP